MPEGASFFAGLLKGFGGGLQEAEAKRAAADLQKRQILGNILASAWEADPTQETWEAIAQPFAQILGVSLDSLGLGKGSKSPLAGLADPDNFSALGKGLIGPLVGPFVPQPTGPAVSPPAAAPQAGAGLPGRALPPEPPPPGVTPSAPGPSAAAGSLVPGVIPPRTPPLFAPTRPVGGPAREAGPRPMPTTLYPEAPARLGTFSLAPGRQAPSPTAGPVAPDMGLRADGTPKGMGFFGPLRRPDGRDSTEISIGVDFGNGEIEIPTLVPTLTTAEVQTLLQLPEGEPIPKSIEDKAVAFAQRRMAAGLSPFAGPREAQTDLFPQFTRTGQPPVLPSRPMGLQEVQPPRRRGIFPTRAEREATAMRQRTAQAAAETRGRIQGTVAEAMEMVRTGVAPDMETALARLDMGLPAGQGLGEVNARTLFETDRDIFRDLHGRDPDPTERLAMLKQALATERSLTSGTATGDITAGRIFEEDLKVFESQHGPATPADRSKLMVEAVEKYRNVQEAQRTVGGQLETRTNEFLAKQGRNPQEVTKEERAQAMTFVALDLEAERLRAETRKGELTPAQALSNSRGLRREFNREMAAARTVEVARANMHSALDAVLKGARTQGSIAAITEFNTILQPMSVVMVAEFARSETGLSFADRLRGGAQQIIAGGLSIPDDVLKQYVALADAFYANQLAEVDGIVEEYQELAKQYGLNKNFIARRVTGQPSSDRTGASTPNPTSQPGVPGVTRDAQGNWIAVPAGP